MKFGTLLGRLRQQVGYSQKILAKALQWDQSYLSKIENNKRKPPSREVVLVISRRMNLSQEDTDELLLTAQYQPQSLLEIGVDDGDMALKKYASVLKKIRNNVPLHSYLHAQEEIADFLELICIKYLQKVNPTFTKNSLLADVIYTKVKRGGIKALYGMMNHTQGGAVVIWKEKLLLAPIGISPLKNIWHIPAGFVNAAKGDHSAKDIAVRLTKWYLPKAEITVIKELTSEGEALETLDTTNHSLKLGYFPAPFQIFALDAHGDLTTSNGAIFCRFSDLPTLTGGMHPILYEIIKPFVKNTKLIKQVYNHGEQTIQAIIQKRNYQQDMHQFYNERIKKNSVYL